MNTWLIIAILFGSVFITGLLTYLFEGVFSKIKKYLTTFGVSFVLSLLCVHILPELFQSHQYGLGVYLLLGFLIQIILELFSKGIEHGHVHLEEDHHHHHHGAADKLGGTKNILFSLFFGLCVHAFIEGIPLFILEEVHHHGHTHAHVSQGFGMVFFWAILSHKVPVAIVLMLFLMASKLKKSTVFLLFILFAAMTPLGGLVGEMIHGQDYFENLSTNLLAITTGMLLHITTLLIFEEYHNKVDKYKNIGLIVTGIALGIVLFS